MMLNYNFSNTQAKPMKALGGQVCQICGDNVGSTVDGEPFIACDVCAFPVCRPCYEYERKDGNQSCPQCKTRYKRHKGKEDKSVVICNSQYSYLYNESFRRQNLFKILICLKNMKFAR